MATAHRLLRTLRDQGMVHVDVGNRYHLGTHCLYLRRASSKMWTFGPRTRTRGWAVDDIDNEDGIRHVAAPALVEEHHPVGAISVSAPAERMSNQSLGVVATAIVAAAKQVAAGLGHREGAMQ